MKPNSLTSAIRVVIAGVEGVGKTTLGCNAPEVVHIPLETGFKPVVTEEIPVLGPFDDVMALLDEVIAACQKGKFKHKSLLFDSATALERKIHDKVVRMDPLYSPGNKKSVTMDSALGGYGKAFMLANDFFAEFLAKCDQLVIYGGINIILTCHVFANKVIDPQNGEYDVWDLLLHSPKNNKSYGKREMLTQWADIVGYLHEPMYISKSKDSDVSMGISKNAGRILGVERIPAYVAKNRFNMRGEIAISHDQCWNYLAHAIYLGCGLDVYNRG
jgi:hypothetical protein